MKPPPPTAAAVAGSLDSAKGLWDALRRRVSQEFGPITEEWVYSGAKHGWALRLARQKRAVLYLKPLEGYFRASLALGPRAVTAALQNGPAASMRRLIEEAPKYPEGKAVRVDVRSPEDLAVVAELVAIKVRSQ